mmetsp:Transcript_17623/g.45108  ORF Transcript_17623/g.45108 Transcript_17623/m.45108 type:complete len:263 (-) Transcript_17623:148-936(-)
MFQHFAARAARPAAGTVAAAAAAATAAPSANPLPALADASYRDRPLHGELQAHSETLTVFPGAKRGSTDEYELEEHEVWNLVDSHGDISVDEVRVAAEPILVHLQSPSSGDDSDGFEADSVMHRTEAIINNVTELLNDPEFQSFARNHRAMKEMMATMRTGPCLLPDLAVPRSTVEIKEVEEEADIKSPIEQLAEGLKFVGDQLGKMWNGIGNFFKGAAANITRKDKDGESASWDEHIFNVMFTVAVFVLISIVTKRVAVRR